MPDPTLQHHLAYRLVQATVASWGVLQAELDQLDNAHEQVQVYLATLEMLMGYIFHAAEVLAGAGHQVPREKFDRSMEEFVEHVWSRLESMRRQEQVQPDTVDEPSGVH